MQGLTTQRRAKLIPSSQKAGLSALPSRISEAEREEEVSEEDEEAYYPAATQLLKTAEPLNKISSNPEQQGQDKTSQR